MLQLKGGETTVHNEYTHRCRKQRYTSECKGKLINHFEPNIQFTASTTGKHKSYLKNNSTKKLKSHLIVFNLLYVDFNILQAKIFITITTTITARSKLNIISCGSRQFLTEPGFVRLLLTITAG